MQSTLRFILATLILLIPFACVSFNEFSDKETQLEQCEESKKQISNDLKEMEAERLRHNEHLAILEARLISSNEIASK